ncbi:MAG TPA: FAD-binding oxidoreductase, partial [Sphingomonadales bacterium]
MTDQDLLAALESAAGKGSVLTDMEARRLAAADLHVTGALPAAVVRPQDRDALAAAVAAATSRGYAVLPRGGGLSYTGGYAPPTDRSVTFDLSALDRIIHISEQDMVMTVEAGVTWRQIAAALKPRGLRLPFFGTFSGAGATVGGGLSHGALFFGSARYGSAAEMVLGLEVVLADGRILRTGQGALAVGAKPFLRSFGPDLTGLFTHDGGAFGIKTAASLRLIEAPRHEDYLSFAFADLAHAADALSAIARADLAEEIYVLDPVSTGAIAADGGEKLRTALSVARRAGGPLRAASALLSLARGGTQFIPPGHYSLHMTAAGRCAAAVRHDLRRAARIAADLGGRP